MSTTIEDQGWRQRAAALADGLVRAGVLTDPRWRVAIEQTPRHVFVPCFYGNDDSIIDGANPDTAAAWLTSVYSDDSLVTQLAHAHGADQAWPTSSSTMPSLMVRMLELLNVTDGARVLEIGTATGYNAALLCHRLSPEQVTSVELHPELAATATERLSALGACGIPIDKKLSMPRRLRWWSRCRGRGRGCAC